MISVHSTCCLMGSMATTGPHGNCITHSNLPHAIVGTKLYQVGSPVEADHLSTYFAFVAPKS
ncbi:hypothetical protein SLEP1_g6715 [Rubroshorea leprosula]|uniref:Uncharacterized protein n=1 Tax=Rubroshorea leprosula TaxID=152421 RepID=A0AAV5I6X8_9ROSI|nr:hypothetical protein SLEP1_g6715 [Rubroshorea leprosula]